MCVHTHFSMLFYPHAGETFPMYIGKAEGKRRRYISYPKVILQTCQENPTWHAPVFRNFFVAASNSQEAQEKEDMHVCTGDVI